MMNTASTDAPEEFAVKLICTEDHLFPKWPGNVTLTLVLKVVVQKGFVKGKSCFLRSTTKMDPSFAFGQRLLRTKDQKHDDGQGY